MSVAWHAMARARRRRPALVAAGSPGDLSAMDNVMNGFAVLVVYLRGALLVFGAAAALAAAIAWGVRTRRLNPFGVAGRFSRRWIDPLLAPVERMVLRTGGTTASVPGWGLVVALVGGALLLTAVQAGTGLITEVAWAMARPMGVPILLLSWMFALLRLALIVRVVASWLPVSGASWWMRGTYRLTEWMLRPLRGVIPSFGAVDLTPLVAYLGLWLIQSLLRIP